MPEAYDQNYEDELFARLAPKIESAVNQSFAGRGANFGAQKAMLADRLSKLRTEIALNSAEKRFAQAEQVRQEGVRATETEKARQARAGELAANANEREMTRQQTRTRDERALLETRADQDKQRRYENFVKTGVDKHQEFQDLVPGKQTGGIVDTTTGDQVDALTGQPLTTAGLSEEEKKKKKIAPYTAGTGTEPALTKSGFILNPGFAASSYQKPPDYGPTSTPTGGGTGGERSGRGTDSGGRNYHYENGRPVYDDDGKPVESESTGKDFFQGSGDINKDTPNEFQKIINDVVDTGKQIFVDPFKDWNPGGWFAPSSKGAPSVNAQGFMASPELSKPAAERYPLNPVSSPSAIPKNTFGGGQPDEDPYGLTPSGFMKRPLLARR